MRFGSAVIERAGPFVTGDFESAIIAFEESMMDLVMYQVEAKRLPDRHAAGAGPEHVVENPLERVLRQARGCGLV